MPLFELKNVGKTYSQGKKTITILKDLNFMIPPHAFYAILGASGSGKSTLLYLLGLLDTCSNGEISFRDQPIHRFSEKEKASFRSTQTGFIFQSFYLLPYLNVLENVMLPYLYGGTNHESWERARAVLAQVGLSHRENHLPGELSGGECQRVAIARALVKKPLILFADEPTGNLDPATAKEILTLLQKLHEQGSTILLVTHDPQASEFAAQAFRLENKTLHPLP